MIRALQVCKWEDDGGRQPFRSGRRLRGVIDELGAWIPEGELAEETDLAALENS